MSSIGMDDALADSCVRKMRTQAEELDTLRAENKRLRDALTDAEKSLWTISVQVGLNDYLSEYSDIRGYARNRSICTTEALKGTP